MNCCNRFVLQNAHYDPAIFGLSLFRLFIATCSLSPIAPGASILVRGNLTLLKQNARHILGPTFTEFLV